MANLTGIAPLATLRSADVVTSYRGIDGVSATATVSPTHGGPVVSIMLMDAAGAMAVAVIVAEYKPGTFEHTSCVVTVTKRTSGMAASRLNRILSGYGVPKVEWYHRTKSMAVRTPGSALPLPATFDIRVTPTAYEWRIVADGTTRDGVTPRSGAVTAATATTLTATPVATPALGTSVPLTPPVTRATIRESLESVSSAPRPEAGIREVRREVKAPVTVTRSTPPASDPLGLLTYPTPSPKSAIELTTDNAESLDVIWRQHVSGDRQVIALFGPTGSGKTSVVYDLAASKGVGVFQFDAPGATTFMDWVGATAVVERGGTAVTEYQPSALMQVLDADGPYAGQPRIALVDEVNRAESGAATNFLMSILHGVAAVYVPDARRTIRIDPAVLVVFTGNIGSAYSATIPLDPALLDRMENVLHFDYPDEKAEVRILRNRVPSLDAPMAERLVKAARQTRVIADRGEIEVGVSSRRLIAAAKKVALGMKPFAAARICWANSYSAEGGERSPRAIVTAAIEGALR